MKKRKTLSAIDLYSGVGGWSLGLKLAGIRVVASYEWWRPALRSNTINNLHEGFEGDIRARALNAFKHDVDIVVGSPPCTEFSFSNRGGKGDIEDGLRDIRKFLEVVEYIKPRFWLMENVPRVADIVKRELASGGSLSRFASLAPQIHIVDMAQFGLPQSRSRCIAGNIDFRLLLSYQSKCPRRTLGGVIRALSKPTTVVDPIYGIRCKAINLIDHEFEVPLSPEEERMNREAKTYHPVYNNMSFPDRIDRPVRTITATCTRVSRESVIVGSQQGQFRRLTARERATLQGFPITFQFYGDSYQQKLKLIGNAIPPLFTFYVGQAMRGVPASRLKKPAEAIKAFVAPTKKPKQTTPDQMGRTFPVDRRFRAALPHLRFKSGVRFELANAPLEGKTAWNVKFFFGNSKNIHELLPDEATTNFVLARVKRKWNQPEVDSSRTRIMERIGPLDSHKLQRAWARASVESHAHPYDLVDFLGHEARTLLDLLETNPAACLEVVQQTLEHWARTAPAGIEVQGVRKVLENSPAVLSGLLIGGFANEALARPRLAAPPEPPPRNLLIAA